MGFSRQEDWSWFPFPSPGGLPHPGIKPTSAASPALPGEFFTTTATDIFFFSLSPHHLMNLKCFQPEIILKPTLIPMEQKKDSKKTRELKPVKWKVTQSCPTLYNPMTILSMGFSRPEYGSREPFPSSGDLLNPGIEPRSPALQEDSLPSELSGKPASQQNVC